MTTLDFRILLLEGEEDGEYEDRSLSSGLHVPAAGDSSAGWGVAAADMDLDGRDDLLVVNGPFGFTETLFRLQSPCSGMGEISIFERCPTTSIWIIKLPGEAFLWGISTGTAIRTSWYLPWESAPVLFSMGFPPKGTWSGD